MGLEGLSICPLCRAQPSYLVMLPVSEVACWLPPEGPAFPAIGPFLAAILLQKVSVLGYSLLSYIAASPGAGQMRALS